jgi:hypothetical protein
MMYFRDRYENGTLKPINSLKKGKGIAGRIMEGMNKIRNNTCIQEIVTTNPLYNYHILTKMVFERFQDKRQLLEIKRSTL